ncbi:hypothetical protein SAMD00019534_026240 [Acytostelium subglobosum LB1]|uniref:hypothetical protein n=1 Tax=Acytostelium subglobosum LB1 TaxID=1410327 RepID=UPI0006449933|nr:hypothetical protein SAMD00019534_026240 [Acytostelium subglobosum LB1]GAM19449.1 hypothetical protein SAMD00019534_026240 [Acytostelium subglobosum LB1]|eukprot:XP_012757376.1 hypothetical protein SAMD00019534_026240 [Acytostelium subglobosum LB1]
MVRSTSPDRYDSSERMQESDAHHHHGSKPSGGERRGETEETRNRGNSLHVANLTLKLKDEELREKFAPFGNIIECTILVDPNTKQSRGFAFITYSTTDEAEEAMRVMDGEKIDGNEIKVSKVTTHQLNHPAQQHSSSQQQQQQQQQHNYYYNYHYDDINAGYSAYTTTTQPSITMSTSFARLSHNTATATQPQLQPQLNVSLLLCQFQTIKGQRVNTRHLHGQRSSQETNHCHGHYQADYPTSRTYPAYPYPPPPPYPYPPSSKSMPYTAPPIPHPYSMGAYYGYGAPAYPYPPAYGKSIGYENRYSPYMGGSRYTDRTARGGGDYDSERTRDRGERTDRSSGSGGSGDRDRDRDHYRRRD